MRGLLAGLAAQGIVLLALLPSKSDVDRVVIELDRGGELQTLMRAAIAGDVDCDPLAQLTGVARG